MSWLEDYLAGLSPEDRAEFDATAAKAPDPVKAVGLTTSIALRFRSGRRKTQPKKTA